MRLNDRASKHPIILGSSVRGNYKRLFTNIRTSRSGYNIKKTCFCLSTEGGGGRSKAESMLFFRGYESECDRLLSVTR
jgi:hypothetical protein